MHIETKLYKLKFNLMCASNSLAQAQYATRQINAEGGERLFDMCGWDKSLAHTIRENRRALALKAIACAAKSLVLLGA